MERTITWTSIMVLFLALVNVGVSAPTLTADPWILARHRKPTKLTTKTPLPNKTTLITPTTINPNEKVQKHHEIYYQNVIQKPRLIERYDKRALDGHYEYRYVLSNGDVRYERAYWQPVGHTKVLARKGFYSYPLPNHRFYTVFYTADHNGYREDESSYTLTQPNLPRSLEITTTNAISEKPGIEKKKNYLNQKSNWTPTTTKILQKGRIGAIGQEIGFRRKPGPETTPTTNTKSVGVFETSASAVTNRPQINSKASEVTVATEESTTEVPAISSNVTLAISTSAENETINPIKVESTRKHRATMETETEQLETVEAVDTTTVLSVD